MQTTKYAGLIECGDTTWTNWADNQSEFDGFHLKKILIKQGSHNKENYPEAELVQDTESIMNDDSIELVIVSGPCESDLNLVAEAIEAGKQVRVL